jgi:hypothetical protein
MFGDHALNIRSSVHQSSSAEQTLCRSSVSHALPVRFCRFFSANSEFLFQYPNDHSTVSWNRCHRHLQDFSQLSGNSAYYLETCVAISLLISWKFSVTILHILRQDIMFTLCSITSICMVQNLKQNLNMNNKRNVIDLVQGTSSYMLLNTHNGLGPRIYLSHLIC